MASLLKLLLVSCLSIASVVSTATSLPYLNSNLPVVKRVDDLLSRLTFLEQLAQTRNLGGLLGDKGTYNKTFVETFNDGYGAGTISFGNYQNPAYLAASVISSIITNKTASHQFHIPLINVADSVNGVTLLNATLFPASLSMGSSWNIPLFERVADAISIENRAVGVHWVFSPTLDLARELRYGRVGEMYGEDPYLVGRFGVAHVENMQARDSKGTIRVAATIKHFVYGSSEGGINLSPIAGGINDFYNIYSLPHRMVIEEAKPAALMPSYASFDGVPMTANIDLTHDFLRGELGFDGVFSSDYGAVSDLWQHHAVAKDMTEAGLLSIKAGIDHEICDPKLSGMEALGKLQSNKEIVALVKEAARRMLTLKFSTGSFEEPIPDLKKVNTTLRTRAHQDLNLEISKESVVLLKNDGTLPLNPGGPLLKKVAVIGPLAKFINAGSYAGDDYVTGSTFFRGVEGIAEEVSYSRGCFVNNDTMASGMIAEAVEAAKSANLAVLVLGSSSSNFVDNTGADRTDGEFYDHAHLDFPGPQPELLKAVVETGVPVVVVLSGGQAFTMEYAVTNASAIIHTFLQGEVGGEALASILTGKTNPSGKLTISLPRDSAALPVYYNYLPTNVKAGIFTPTDYQWPVMNRTARYPFGFGLSYTTFKFSNVRVSNYTSTAGSVNVSVEVTNTGETTGKEVVQVYFGQQFAKIERPYKNLIRFSKIELLPRASKHVSFSIPVKELGYFVNGKRRVDEADYNFWVGSSSDADDLTLKVASKA